MVTRVQPATVPETDGLVTGGGGGGGTPAAPGTVPDTIALGVNAAGAPRVLRRTSAGGYVIDTPPAGIFPPTDFESTPARSVNAARDTLAYVDIRRSGGNLQNVVRFGTDTVFVPAATHDHYEPWEPGGGQETVVARSVSATGQTLNWVELRRIGGEFEEVVDFGTDTVHVEHADHDHYEPWPPADASSTGSEMHHVVLNHGETWDPAVDMAADSILRSVQIDVLEGAASITDSAGNAVAYTEMGITISDVAGVDIGSIDADETLPGLGARVLVIWQEVPAP